jgi:superfamily I DNA/RNA helicase
LGVLVPRSVPNDAELGAFLQHLDVDRKRGIATSPRRTPVLNHVSVEDLLGYGVPPEWTDQVRTATEDELLELATRLPAEAAEALLQLATGGTPETVRWTGPGVDPFEHPDAKRRFRTVADADELAAALDYPWDRWTVFLHPAQREAVEREYGGPARISGTAGTGKTIVALHRAVFLARTNPDARILLTTFSDALANALRIRLRRLVASQPRLAERIDVAAIDAIALRLHELNLGPPQVTSPEAVRELLREAHADANDSKFSLHFVASEWHDVVDAWQLRTWEDYRDVARLGRKTRLPEKQRELLWTVFRRARELLDARGLMTPAGMYGALAAHFSDAKHRPFDHIVVDEAQDISIPQLRFLAALGGDRPNALFFTGDLGQRIFQQPFSWKSLGVQITGRARTLRVNYRTSHQIRSQADRLLAPEISDADGNTERRRGTVSVFNGPDPMIQILDSREAELEAVARWVGELNRDGIAPEEVAVFVRSLAEVDRAKAAVDRVGLQASLLDERMETSRARVSIGTMHLAKGLEFRAVAVMACDDGVIPLEERISAVGDDADLEDVYNTERHLLYVACTRARESLLITAVDPASEFLDDMR